MIEHTDDVQGPRLPRHAPQPGGALAYPRSVPDRRARIALDLGLPVLPALGLTPGWAAKLRAALAGACCPPIAVDAPTDDELPLLQVLSKVTSVTVAPCEVIADRPAARCTLAHPVIEARRTLLAARAPQTAADALRGLRAAVRRVQEKTPLAARRDGDPLLAEQLVPWHAPQTAWWLLLAAESHDAGDLGTARRLFEAARDLPSASGGREVIAWLVLTLAPLSPTAAMAIGLRVFGQSNASDAVLRLAPVLRDPSAVTDILGVVADPATRAAATLTAATWLAEHGWPREAAALMRGDGPLPRTALPLVEALVEHGQVEAAEHLAERLPTASADRAFLAVSRKSPAAAARIADLALRVQALAALDDRAALDALACVHDAPEVRVAAAAVAARRGDADCDARRAWALEAVEAVEEPRRHAHLRADLGTRDDLLAAGRIAARLDGWDARPLLDRVLDALVAREMWDEAREIDDMQDRPELRLAETRISFALARLGRFEEARVALDKVARLQFDAGDRDGAARTLARALDATATSTDDISRLTALVHAAGSLRHCGRADEAREVLGGCLSTVRALPARYVSLGTQLPLELVRCGLEDDALEMAASLSGDRMVVEVAARLRDRRRARDVAARSLAPTPAQREDARPLGDLLALLGGAMDASLDPELADLFPTPPRDLGREAERLRSGEPGELDDVLRCAASVGDEEAVMALLPLAASDDALTEVALEALRWLLPERG